MKKLNFQTVNFVGLMASGLMLFMIPSTSYSHANLDFNRGMTPRSNSTSIKTSDINAEPCGSIPGPQAAAASTTRLVLTPGQTFNVKWIETINHSSKYRLAFSPDINDNFTTVLMDVNNFDQDSDPNKIPAADRQDKGISGGKYNYYVTVPDAVCDDCAIQLIQKMYSADNLSMTKYIGCMDIQIVDPATLAKPQAPVGISVEWE